MISLLDANVLIALVDRDHSHNPEATLFFRQAMKEGWATCPLTENAFLRILGHPAYPRGPGSPNEARKLLAAYCRAPGHQFWPDDVSLLDERTVPKLPVAKDLTDFYLLALAREHGGRLATFDRRIRDLEIPENARAWLLLEPCS